MLRVGDRVVFAGGAHTVVAISGTVIRLLSAAGQTTVVALGYLLAAEDFELVGAAPAPKVDPLGLLETLPEKVVQAARTWERHLIEVDTGVAPDAPEGTLPRPEYDPVTHSLAARQRAKAVELTAAGTRTSVRTVERMRQRYREQGLWGLVDTRYARAVNRRETSMRGWSRRRPRWSRRRRRRRRARSRGRSGRFARCWTTSTVRVWCRCRRGRPVTGYWKRCRPGSTPSGRRRRGGRRRTSRPGPTP